MLYIAATALFDGEAKKWPKHVIAFYTCRVSK